MDPSCTSGDSSLTPLEALDLPQDPSKQKEQSWTTVTSKSGARSPNKTPPGSPSSNRRPLGPTWSPKYKSNPSSAHSKPQVEMEDPSANNPPQWGQTSTTSTTSGTTDPPSDSNKYSPFSGPPETPLPSKVYGTASGNIPPQSSQSSTTGTTPSPSNLDQVMEDAHLDTPAPLTLDFALKIPSTSPIPDHRKVMETILAAYPDASIHPSAENSKNQPITTMATFPRDPSSYKQFFLVKTLPQSGSRPAVTIVKNSIRATCTILELKKSANRVMKHLGVKMLNQELEANSVTAIGWLNAVIPRAINQPAWAKKIQQKVEEKLKECGQNPPADLKITIQSSRVSRTYDSRVYSQCPPQTHMNDLTTSL